MDIWLSNTHLIEETLRKMRRGQIAYREFVPNIAVRWDSLSYAFYGNPWLEEILHRANPQHLATTWAPAGAVLKIPELEKRPWVDPNSLPPWDSRRLAWRR